MKYKKIPDNINPYVMSKPITDFPILDKIEDFHGGEITTQNIDVIKELKLRAKTRSKHSFRWNKVSIYFSGDKLTAHYKFSGRTTTECALLEEPERSIYLETNYGPVNQYDIRAEVPSTLKLFWSGEWHGTSTTVHLRKDIMKDFGIKEETKDDKCCTFRWCFEPSIKKAVQNFKSSIKGSFRKTPAVFSMTEEQFIKGWFRMQHSLFGIPVLTVDDLTKAEPNVAKDWKQSTWWWTGRIEEETKKLIQKAGYEVDNAYDCFYSLCPIPTMIKFIDQAAKMVYQEYQKEKTVFLSKWDTSIYSYGMSSGSSRVMSSGYSGPGHSGDRRTTAHKRSGPLPGTEQVGGNRNNGIEEQELRQELAVFCHVSIKTINRERHSGMTPDEIKNKKRRNRK